MSKRSRYHFQITYFTFKGKEVTSTDYAYDCLVGNDLQPVMKSIREHIRGCANDDSQHSGLPGLDGHYFNGYILIQRPGCKSYIVKTEPRHECRNKGLYYDKS